jgi:hypothetical protein
MRVEDDIRLRLSAQRALLTHVTPRLRAVSLDYDSGKQRVWVRFTFDGQPSESVRDAASCAGTEVLADYPEGWDITEEFVVCPAPDPMEHRRLLVYHRCEDSWVTDAEPGAAPDRGGMTAFPDS